MVWGLGEMFSGSFYGSGKLSSCNILWFINCFGEGGVLKYL